MWDGICAGITTMSNPLPAHAVLKGAAELLEDQVTWMGRFCSAMAFEPDRQAPGLLLAAVRGGLLRSLAAWAQQACQQIKKGQVNLQKVVLEL